MSFSKRKDEITAWVLTTSILLYPLLTYLVTPSSIAHTNGQLTVICTLQGLEEIYLDADGQPIENSDFNEHCPALELFKLAGSAFQSPLPVKPSVLFYRAGLLPSAASHEYLALHFSPYASRAPPSITDSV